MFGTVTLCCCSGSGSGTGSDFGSDPDNILHSFPTTKSLYKILLFQCQKQHYCPESWPLIFDFLLFYYILCWIRIRNGICSVSVSAMEKKVWLLLFRLRFHNTDKKNVFFSKRLILYLPYKIIRTNWKPVPVMKLTENAFWTKERNKKRCVM